MLIVGLTSLALAAGSVHALEHSSPLFFYSASNLDIPTIASVSSASSVQSSISNLLSQCPTTNYVVVAQSGVNAEDYICPKNTPFLKDHSSLMIRDVVGDIDAMSLASAITRACGKDIKIITSEDLSFPDLNQTQRQNKVFYTALPPLEAGLTTQDRKVVLQQHDNYLSSLAENYFASDDFTLVYVTHSVHAAEQELEQHEYEAEIPLADIMHSGELLRRSLVARDDGVFTNVTLSDGPLFAKYQFLSPGIFSGLLVGSILLSILYVGISALSSLQVTYGAFDKEQGQLANKKS